MELGVKMRKTYLILFLMLCAVGTEAWGVSTTEGLHLFGLYGDAYYTTADDRIVKVLDCAAASGKELGSLNASWSKVRCAGADANDSDYSRTNGATVQFDGDDSQTSMLAANTFATQNLTNCFAAIAYYIEDTEHLTAVLFEIRTDSSNYYQSAYMPTTVGWHYLEFDITGGCKAFGSPDITDITSVKIQCGLTSASPCNATIHLDSFRFIKNQAPSGNSVPVVQLHFDDGLDEHYDTVRGILNSRGIDANFGIVADYVGAAGYMTAAQVTQMEREGHLICNHSYDHTRFSDENGDGTHTDHIKYYERIEQMIRGKEYCSGQGWETANYYYIHPGGTTWYSSGNSAADGTAMPEDEQIAATRFLLQNYPIVRLTNATGADSPRASIDGMIARHTTPFEYTFPNGSACARVQYALLGSDLSTLQNHKDVIDSAVASDSMASFIWHTVGAGGDITTSDLEELLDYAIAQGCEFVTMADVQPENSYATTASSSSGALHSGMYGN
jgi:peptidoglycan/xylan/chitin deacetylase (PgdA/CDA1 family)